jgi:hypothetical protein
VVLLGGPADADWSTACMGSCCVFPVLLGRACFQHQTYVATIDYLILLCAQSSLYTIYDSVCECIATQHFLIFSRSLRTINFIHLKSYTFPN